MQKFGGLITSGKIIEPNDETKVAELLSQSRAFYDADMVTGLNAILYYIKDKTVNRATSVM